MDFTARRDMARKEMQPHLEEAAQIKAKIVSLKEQLKAKKKEKAERSIIGKLQTQIKAQEKLAREAKAKADAIDAAVYDLKAVNPNAVTKVDTRTPQEIIESIEAHGKIVSDAMKRLRELMAAAD